MARGTHPPPGFLARESRLRLEFQDFSRDRPGAPRDLHAQRIIDYAEQIRHAQGSLLIHCAAGISRSTAAAILVASTWLGPGSETEAVSWILSVRPQAQPNRLLLMHGETLLGRGEALQNALREALFQA